MIPKSIIIAVAIAGVGFGAGAKFGQSMADGHWVRVRAKDAISTANMLQEADIRLQTVMKEREQCRAEVSKVNEATAQQAEKVTRLIVADQVKRDTAAQKAAIREKQSEQRLSAAFSTLDELRRLINEGAFNGCASEHVGADIVGMLNAALSAGSGEP